MGLFINDFQFFYRERGSDDVWHLQTKEKFLHENFKAKAILKISILRWRHLWIALIWISLLFIIRALQIFFIFEKWKNRGVSSEKNKQMVSLFIIWFHQLWILIQDRLIALLRRCFSLDNQTTDWCEIIIMTKGSFANYVLFYGGRYEELMRVQIQIILFFGKFVKMEGLFEKFFFNVTSFLNDS